MNYINNGEYYLVAHYPNDKTEVVNLKRGWYSGDKNDETIQQRVDISSIDLITTEFNNEEQMKSRMFEKKYIKSIEADLYIAHSYNINRKEHIKQYEIIYNESDRTNIIKPLAKKRLNNESMTRLDTDDLYNKLIKKSFNKYSFYKLMTSPWSNVDIRIKDELIEQRTNEKENYNIKYSIKDNYTTIRNIIYMWNLYDNLVKEYIKTNKSYTEEDLAKGIIELYKQKLNKTDLRKEKFEELKPAVDRKNVSGQIGINEYLDSTKKPPKDAILVKRGDALLYISYSEIMNEMIENEKKIKESPYDDINIGELVKKYGTEYAIRTSGSDVLKKLSLEDKYRLGLIGDYVEYKNLTREKKKNNGKRRR